MCHEFGPIHEQGIGDEESGDGVVCNSTRRRLAEEVAGYRHTDYALELELGHAGSAGEFGVGNGAFGRDVREDVKVAQPSEAGAYLILGETNQQPLRKTALAEIDCAEVQVRRWIN